MAYKKDKEPEEKRAFEEPKMVDLTGKEITKENLTDEDLEGVSGGLDNTCNGGGGNNCNGGSSSLEEA
jgi:hypothetical protein